jgi:hypothetical protein
MWFGTRTILLDLRIARATRTRDAAALNRLLDRVEHQFRLLPAEEIKKAERYQISGYGWTRGGLEFEFDFDDVIEIEPSNVAIRHPRLLSPGLIRWATFIHRDSLGHQVTAETPAIEQFRWLVRNPFALFRLRQYVFAFTVEFETEKPLDCQLTVRSSAGAVLTMPHSTSLLDRASATARIQGTADGQIDSQILAVTRSDIAVNEKSHGRTKWLNFALRSESAGLLELLSAFPSPRSIHTAKSLVSQGAYHEALSLLDPAPVDAGHPRIARLQLRVPSLHPGEEEASLTSHASFQPERPVLLSDIEVWHGRFVTKGNAHLVLEDGADPRLAHVAGLHPYVWGRPTCESALFWRPSGETERIESALVMAGRLDQNWFHWLIEVLPHFLELDSSAAQEIPVFVRDDLPSSAYEALTSLSQRPLVLRGQETKVAITHAHSSMRRSVGFDTPWRNREVAGRFNAPLLKALSARLLCAPLVQQQIAFAATPERVAVVRQSGYRSIKNLAEVSDRLNELNYARVDPAQLTFQQQVALFARAKSVVIQGGAALANCIFMTPGARLQVLVSGSREHSRFWSPLFEAFELDYSFVESKQKRFANSDDVQSSFLVPPQRIQ